MSQVGIESIGYALKRVQAALHAAMDTELRAHGLTVSQYACLQLLAHQPGLTNAQLARGAFVSRQAMHQLLAGMRAAGTVDGDGRGRHERYTMTPAGTERLAAAAAAIVAVQERMLAPLDDDRRRRLHADLTACADALARTETATTAR